MLGPGSRRALRFGAGTGAIVGALVLAGCGSDEDTTVASPAPAQKVPTSLEVTSSAFDDGATIPERFTCRGEGPSPPVSWTGVPDAAESVALVVTDPDAPGGTFVHWVIYDLPPGDGDLANDEVPADTAQADNSSGSTGWTPPCPPSGTHHYVFTVYAVDGDIADGSTQDVIAAVRNNAVGSGVLTGLVKAQ